MKRTRQLLEETTQVTVTRRRVWLDSSPPSERPPAVVEASGVELPSRPLPALASCPAAKVVPFRSRKAVGQ